MDRAKTESALVHVAAEFVNRESNRRSLITVTRVELDDRGHKARIYVTIFPDTQVKAALDFLGRVEDDFIQFARTRIKMQTLPRCTFVQDPNIGGLDVGKEVPIE
jgi:ribosome-binding factor A